MLEYRLDTSEKGDGNTRSIYFDSEVYDVQTTPDFETKFRALGWLRMHWKIIN